jgi:hypothetical protein
VELNEMTHALAPANIGTNAATAAVVIIVGHDNPKGGRMTTTTTPGRGRGGWRQRAAPLEEEWTAKLAWRFAV